MLSDSEQFDCIVICAPYPEYKEQPNDQSKCDLFYCPHCKNKMWLSQKKKGILLFASHLNKKILLACYNCIISMVKKNPEKFKDLKMKKIK